MAEVVKQEPSKEEKETKVEPKEETKKVTKKAQPKKKKKKQPKQMVHVDDFVETAKELLDLSEVQAAGFKAYMNGRAFQPDHDVFGKYLEEYLGN